MGTLPDLRPHPHLYPRNLALRQICFGLRRKRTTADERDECRRAPIREEHGDRDGWDEKGFEELRQDATATFAPKGSKRLPGWITLVSESGRVPS